MLLKIISPPLRWLVILLLILGVGLRFANLDRKIFWHDEVFTAVRATGHSGEEVVAEVFTGQPIAPSDLQQYLNLTPRKTWGDTMTSLIGHPEHPPLYYLLVRLWMTGFGSSVAVVRSLSAVIGLLVFPGLYWLCLELFSSARVGGVAIALFAVSPFHVLYAQEAREYSLWTVTIVLSCAALLHARRTQKPWAWGLYTVSLIAGLYTSLFALLPMVAQGLYILIEERGRWTPTLKAAFWSWSGALLAFVPWMVAIATQVEVFQSKTNWIHETLSLPLLATLWGLHISSPFVDLGLDITDPRIGLRIGFMLLLFGFSLYQLCRHTAPRTWLLVLCLVGITAIAFILPDLLFGGRRSASSRYFIPVMLGLQLAVAFSIGHALSHPRRLGRSLGQGLLATLLTVGIASCLIIAPAPTWWNKWGGPETLANARFLNQHPRALLVSDSSNANVGNLISLSLYLQPTVQLLLLSDRQQRIVIPPSTAAVYTFSLSHASRQLLMAEGGQLQPTGVAAITLEEWLRSPS